MKIDMVPGARTERHMPSTQRHTVASALNCTLTNLIELQQFTDAENWERIRQQHEAFNQQRRHENQLHMLRLVCAYAAMLGSLMLVLAVILAPYTVTAVTAIGIAATLVKKTVGQTIRKRLRAPEADASDASDQRAA